MFTILSITLLIPKLLVSIIIASSDKAYGEYDIADLPYKENYDLRPLYPYDVSKAACQMAQWVKQEEY